MDRWRWGALALCALGVLGCSRDEWVELQAGGTRSCVRSEAGSVACWGGRLDTAGQVPTLHGSKAPEATPEQPEAVALCVGQSFVCARIIGGKVTCLGPEEDAGWTVLTGLNGITQLACSDGGGCGLATTGELSCWAWTAAGPGALTTVPNLADPLSFAVGLQHRCAVAGDGTLWCWGRNGAGQLGVSPQATPQSDTPIQVKALDEVKQVAAGRDFTCALRTDGKVRCFGSNLVGQLGYGGTSSVAPVEVVNVADAQEIAAGEYHACARLSSGEVHCWGRNLKGQLGDRTQEDRKGGVTVFGLTGATRVTAGTAHTCSLGVPGEVNCWGQNSSGQLGDGTFDDRSTKVVVDLPRP